MIAIMIAIAKSFHVLQDAAKQNQFTACPRRYGSHSNELKQRIQKFPFILVICNWHRTI